MIGSNILKNSTTTSNFLLWLITPGLGLLITWLIAGLVLLNANPTAGYIFLLAGVTLLLVLMLVIAAFLPPARPWRETSALGARIFELAKLLTGAALFGAAAVYGVFVSASMNKMPAKDAFSLENAGQFVWPIVSPTLIVGSVFIGVRLGWDFYRSSPETRQKALHQALQKLNLLLPESLGKENFLFLWISQLITVCSRNGLFIGIGYAAPVVVYFDIHFITEHITATSELVNNAPRY